MKHYSRFFLPVLFAFFAIFLPTMDVSAQSLTAQTTPPVGLVLRPLDKSSIVLNAYTVDVHLDTRAGGGSEVTFVVRARLHNPSTTKPAVISLNTRGRHPDGTPIQNLQFAVGQNEDVARPFSNDHLTRTLQPDERLWLTFVYTETVPASPWMSLHYDLNALRAWPHTVGSVRFTLHIPSSLPRAAFLQVSPDPSRFDSQRLEWQWEELTPRVPVRVLFLLPQTWQRISTLRSRSQSGDMAATEALAKLLHKMVVSKGSPPQVVNWAYPEALGLWARLTEEKPNDPAPWRVMATLYARRAQIKQDPETYRSLILNALENAWKRGDRDPTIRQELASVVRSQVDHLRGEGRWQEALQQLDALSNLLGPSGEMEIKKLREQIALAWVQERLQARDKQGVRKALVAGWGSMILNYFQAQLPSFRYLQLDVHTEEHQRQIIVSAILEPGATPSPAETWHTWLQALRAAAPEAQIIDNHLGNTVVMTARIPFQSASQLRDVEFRLASTVPTLPEWELLRDALSPTRLEQPRQVTFWGERVGWLERVDLSKARQDLDNAMTTLQALSHSALPREFPHELVQVRETLRHEDIAAWQALRDTERVTYVLRWDKGWGPPLARRWQLQSGDRALMQASRIRIDPLRAGTIGGALLLLWTALTLILWLTLGRG